MKVTNFIASAIVAGAAMTAVNSVAHVAAASPGDSPTCKFIYEYDLGKGFKRSNGKVTTTVRVEGDKNCRKDITMAVWKVYNKGGNPYPLKNQKLHDHMTLTQLKPGRYSLSANLPDCFYQVDVVLGKNPTGPNNRLPYENNRMLNATLGGDKKCVEKPPVVVTPTPVVTPVQPVAQQPAAASLPVTGPGTMVSAFFSTAAISGALHSLYRRRR